MFAPKKSRSASQSNTDRSRAHSQGFSFVDNRAETKRVTQLQAVLQKKNSSQPNWYQYYNSLPQGVHNQGIANYIEHIERGNDDGQTLEGFHAVNANGASPNSITMVEDEDIGQSSIGKCLWHYTNHPGANGQAANQAIPLKSSTIFPTRLSQSYGGITGLRAMMKVEANNGGDLSTFAKRAGLTGRITSANNTIYPTGGRLRSAGDVFQSDDVYYRA